MDEIEAERLDREFISELERRRTDMVQGRELVADWRQSLSGIEGQVDMENRA
jgi:hypothetical protein